MQRLSVAFWLAVLASVLIADLAAPYLGAFLGDSLHHWLAIRLGELPAYLVAAAVILPAWWAAGYWPSQFSTAPKTSERKESQLPE